jgi:signal transduction histidine kinase
MHDVLAHRVSLLSLQAGALEFRPDAPPERLAAAAGGVRANAQAVLEELREVIGVLREDVDEGVAAPPQPDLDRLEALLEESRAAGMRVHARLALPAGTRPPTLVGRTAYRVVQEGLTNARKHAAGAGVEVEVAGGPGHGVAVSVVSRPAVRPAPTADGSGLGLVGLRERVALAGGELSHGREESGDFALRAALPWPA